MAKYTKRYEITQDTYFQGNLSGSTWGATNNNYATSSILRISALGNNDYFKRECTLLGFDISDIKYKKINSATLYMYKTGGDDSYSSTLYTYGIRKGWKASEVTGMNVEDKLDPFSLRQESTNATSGWYKYTLESTFKGLQHIDRANNTTHMKNGIALECYFTSEDTLSIFSSTKGSNKPYIEVNYEDAPPLQPTVFEPNSNYINNVEEVTFKWKYRTEVSDAQTGFELQWKHEVGNWTTVSRTTSSESYVMPSNTLPSGRIEWRVRTKNQFNELGPWSEVLTFHAIGLPVAPIVSITQQGARPIVTWAANLQQVYQTQILDNNNKIVYDSGSVPSISGRSHKVAAFLENGAYTARVRIKNEFDLFSNWGSKEFKIETSKPNPPNLNIYNINDGLMVRIDQVINDYLLIFRAEKDSEDYKCIAKTNEYDYRDYSVKGDTEYKYFIRVVLDETFVDSQKVMTKAYLKYSTLAPTSNLADYMQLKSSLNSRPEKNMSLSNLSTKQHYTGRQFPTVDYTTFKNNVYNFTFYLPESELYKFIEMYNRKEAILYRDKRIRVFGDIDGLDIGLTDLDGYSVKFTITETDYNEGGSYFD